MSSNFIEVRRHAPGTYWTYADADRYQQKIRDELLSGKRERGIILMSEVAPVITLGKRRTHDDLLLARDEYEKNGIQLLEIDRGGRATYHGPGQWVVFVIDTLERLVGDRKGVRKVSCALLDALLSTAKEKYPDAEIRSGSEVGVWESSEKTAGKLGAVGIQIDRGILQHGIALNVFRTRESFFGIHPCGISGAKPAFMESIASDFAFQAVGERLKKALLAHFP